MDKRRALDIAGAFLMGGGLVAVFYELPEIKIVVGDGQPEASQDDDSTDDPGGGQAMVAPPGTQPDGGELVEGATGEGAVAEPSGPGPFDRQEDGTYGSFPSLFAAQAPFTAEDEVAFPRYGLVSAAAVTVRQRPDIEAPRLGLIRGGTSVRVDVDRTFGGGCNQGWRQVHPYGWVCMGAGLKVGDEPFQDGTVVYGKLDVENPMPFDYWRVDHNGTALFHRLPSYSEQDEATAASQKWITENGRTPIPTSSAERPEDVPSVVKEYLNAGYYITAASEHVKSKRHFMQTNRGAYARKSQLSKREGSKFRGIVLTEEENLPVYWIRRELPFQKRKEPGSGILLTTEQTPERRSRYDFSRLIRIGDHDYYEDTDGLLMRAYAVSKSAKIKRPPGIESTEHWVHVDISEQTLVAYEGSTPIFTTIVSTGKEKGMTPIGVHRIQSKFIATSMRDQPMEDEAYSIEDVPWTQYFDNNVALHGAFWHGGFGLVRSHGCVNLAPADARWLFGFTSPSVPDSWHAVMPGAKGMGSPSAVVVTE